MKPLLATIPGKIVFALAFASSASLSACAASPSLRAARRGDLVALRANIARERACNTLESDEVKELARETASRELSRATPSEVMARIDEARACSHALSKPLEALARSEGDVGAAATLALLETTPGDKDGQRWLRRYGASPNALWRAVAARAAVGEELGPARRTFYTDGDERVRLAALRAALERGDHTDRRSLLEAARLDPNPLARALASRALGSIADGETVLALRDIYWQADEGLRQSIVDAWGQREAAAAGGLRELIRVAETERGSPPIEAGWVLLRFTLVENAAPVGTRALLRAMGEGLSRDRVLAIMDAPLADPRVLDALRKAAATPDPAVKVAALARLAESRATRDEALRGLSEYAKAGSKEALYAMARAGDRPAAAGVARDLTSHEAETRLAAARALVFAGELARAADLLADPDPHVRMTAACAILSVRDN
jgi:hypothetical protein